MSKFPKATYLDVSGCHIEERVVNECKSLPQYNEVKLIHPGKPLPFDSRLYHLFVCLCPQAWEKSGIDMNDACRLLTYKGYGILGVSEKVWKAENLWDNLQKLNGADLLAVQTIKINDQDYYLSVMRSTQ
jgi:hypothetical protein